MNKSIPFVSIIMPVYNAEKYLKDSINSVLNQSYRNWELIICDDNSRDSSETIIKSFLNDKRIKYLGKTKSLGAFRAKNFLIKESKGDFVTFLDADDLMDENRIEKQLKEFYINKNLGMVGCQVIYVDEKLNVLRKSSKPLDYEDIKSTILQNNVIGGAIMFIKREALNEVGGGFRTNFFKDLSYQDYDLSLLIAEKFECKNLPDYLYKYRQHKSSISKKNNVDRYINKEIVIHLAKQRRKNGSDDIINNNIKNLQNFMEELRKPYIENPSLIYHKYAADYVYNNLFLNAIKASLQALRLEPLKLDNYRLLQHCIRKYIIRF